MATTINPQMREAEQGPESEFYVASMMIRGNALHYFTIAEKLMDDIIRRMTFESEDQYDMYMELFQKGELSMLMKKTLLRFCIERVQKKYNIEIGGFEHVDDIVKRRNSLAHYVIDATDEGLQRFIKNRVVRFVGIDKHGKYTEENFTWESARQFVKRIEAFTLALAAVQKIIIDGKSY